MINAKLLVNVKMPAISNKLFGIINLDILIYKSKIPAQ